MSAHEPPVTAAKQFKCRQCGARLDFAPGTESLVCPYCGASNEIEAPTEAVRELDFRAALAEAEGAAGTHEVLTVDCRECGAQSTLPANVTSAPCPFCGSGLVSAAHSTKSIRPGALLPFHVTQEAARASFQRWLGKLWFAPGDLKRFARIEGAFAGVYVPYWTFDCRTTTDYSGMRGDAYYTTETYTTMVNGRPTIRTRQVRRIRWTPASGRVANAFDDLLVRATKSLPPKQLDALEPWDLPKLVPYRDEYLAGFRAESYQVDLGAGFGRACELMEPVILATCRRDIGGDEQRVTSWRTHHHEIRFKHVLFPVWVSPYRYRGKLYRLLVNARTGEVQGERPWSVAKIVALVLAILAAAALVVLLAR